MPEAPMSRPIRDAGEELSQDQAAGDQFEIRDSNRYSKGSGGATTKAANPTIRNILKNSLQC